MRYGLIGDKPLEMADWQRQAGLVPRKPIGMPLSKGIGLQAADKPAAGGRMS